MPTNATIKLIKQLQQKKYRKKFGLFVVEGRKSYHEFIDNGYILKDFFVTPQHGLIYTNAKVISEKEMQQISSLSTPPNILAVFEQIKNHELTEINQLIFALDGIQDPGNLGTIIRLADWYDMKDLVCSHNTVDLYNPKVVQSSMGSLGRVKVHYVHLETFIQKVNVPIIGTFIEGKNLYKTDFPIKGLIVLGNEANGISKGIEELCSVKISIPQKRKEVESLNVAIASAIIAGEVFAKDFR